jgi:hypothetical protein
MSMCVLMIKSGTSFIGLIDLLIINMVAQNKLFQTK